MKIPDIQIKVTYRKLRFKYMTPMSSRGVCMLEAEELKRFATRSIVSCLLSLNWWWWCVHLSWKQLSATGCSGDSLKGQIEWAIITHHELNNKLNCNLESNVHTLSPNLFLTKFPKSLIIWFCMYTSVSPSPINVCEANWNDSLFAFGKRHCIQKGKCMNIMTCGIRTHTSQTLNIPHCYNPGAIFGSRCRRSFVYSNH
jgi:hypothetical protein